MSHNESSPTELVLDMTPQCYAPLMLSGCLSKNCLSHIMPPFCPLVLLGNISTSLHHEQAFLLPVLTSRYCLLVFCCHSTPVTHQDSHSCYLHVVLFLLAPLSHTSLVRVVQKHPLDWDTMHRFIFSATTLDLNHHGAWQKCTFD